MFNTIRKSMLLIPAFVALGIVTRAQTTEKINIITTAVPFLRISPDAAAGGMGEAGVATGADVNAQFYNVAKYAFAGRQSGFGFNYVPWLKNLGLNDVYLASAAGYYKPDELQAFSGSLRYFSLGDIQLMDHSGNDLHKENPREMSVDLGYSRKLSNRLSLGVALKYIHSSLVGNSTIGDKSYKSGNAVAGDLGLYYSQAQEGYNGWSFGAVFSNLGSKISYTHEADQKSYLPANLGLGAGYTWFIAEDHRLMATGELNKLLVPALPESGTAEDYAAYNQQVVVKSWVNSFDHSAMSWSGGVEYGYQQVLTLRAGYYSDSRSLGQRQYVTAGLGLNYSMLGFNLSYLVPTGTAATNNPLSNTLRFSLLLYPGK